MPDEMIEREAGGPEARIVSFIARARRRRMLRVFLAGSLFSAVANEVVRWSTVGFISWSGRELPVLDVGPLVLAALLALGWLRWSPMAVAGETDARIGFGDRLVSFLDFASRSDIPAATRRAQAFESARALAALPPAAAAPIRPWLWCGPLLLATSLAYPLLFLAGTDPATVGRDAADQPERLARSNEGRRRDHASAQRGARPAQPPVRQEAPPPEDGKRPDAGRIATSPGGSAKSEAPRREKPAETGMEPQQRSQFRSEQVGTSLTKVVSPLYTPGKPPAPPPAAPKGTFAFHLLPKSAGGRGAAAGKDGAEHTASERVAVDFDALPERYRPLVRTYFELLASRPGALAGITPTP